MSDSSESKPAYNSFSLEDVLDAAAMVARKCPLEEYDDAFQEAAIAIISAPTIALGVHAARMDAWNRNAKRRRRQPPAAWVADEEGRWRFQSCQFDPSLDDGKGAADL
jgi:hypothetical protein